jgi:putative DNA methylase
MTTDQRLIEDYLPIEAISAEAKREKSIRKGHISTLHLWWARRPLVACRAAVYGALVPAPTTPGARQKRADFVAELCTYPGPTDKIADARRHILEAHAARLSEETGGTVTVADIEAGRAPRPRVLDMFAGGGAIPLEALRLGCEAHALELNPVAHLIELCTLVYPQQYGQPDPTAVGCLPSPSGRGARGEGGTWAGLAKEVEHWGKWVLKRVKAEIGDLYPPIPDPAAPAQDLLPAPQPHFDAPGFEGSQPALRTPGRTLTPIAYLWTRTVRCKNPACGATVPLARQTWLCKKKNRYVALKPDTQSPISKTVRYRVVEATTEKGLGFDPAAGSRGGNVACPFCGTVADSAYVKAEGQAGRIGTQPMAVVCTRKGERGRVYLSADDLSPALLPDDQAIRRRIEALCAETGLTVPDEPIEANPRSMDVQNYGFGRWSELFTPRQVLALLTFVRHSRAAYTEMLQQGYGRERAIAVTTYFGLLVDRLSDYASVLCTWEPYGELIGHTFTRQALPMVWDFAEVNPLGDASGNALSALTWITDVIQSVSDVGPIGRTQRGSASHLPYEASTFDAVITDPPYYDNVSYSNLSDFFYVWLKRSVGDLHSEHFSSLLTPKKSEVIAAFYRHQGSREQAKGFYEQMMAQAFAEVGRVLKPGGPLVVVYAHKTTLGWATLVDALRVAGFTVTEAWPLDTERSARIRAIDTASLASSIFLVARRRKGDGAGAYETQVRPELEAIVRERVDTLWGQGVSGADLVIAAVGAGLRAFTRFARVEYANGEPVPADTFLAEVEGVVLEMLLEKLFGVPRAGVAGVDAATRFYVLWRYTYRATTIDAGEAIVFAYPQGVELDGPNGLAGGTRALVEKQRGKYRLRDFDERGGDDDLGLPSPRVGRGAEGEGSAPLVDVLHRTLWLMENRPALLGEFLDQALAGRAEQLRLVAQTLAGPALAGEEPRLTTSRGAEAAALRKLTQNWRSLIEENLFRRRA